MKLAEDEQKLTEYFFKGVGDVANMSTLTSRRLVVVYGNAEESYPLSKITAVRIIFNRSWVMLILGVIIGLAGLGNLGSSVIGGLVAIAVGGALAYFGWNGKTRLQISQMGGRKQYVVRGRDAALTEFMDAVNGRVT